MEEAIAQIMSTYKLSIYLTGKNSRAIHITGPVSDAIRSVQILRSFSPVNSQREDDTKLYGVNNQPFGVFTGDPYSQDNRLGEDTDDWELLGTLEDGSCVFVDNTKLPWNKSRDVYYKARIHMDNGYVDTDVTPAGRGQVWPDSQNVKALINNINAEIKLNGRSGYLLKKRQWGKRCPKCTDFGTERVLNGQCPECLGTGYAGGYYEAIPLCIIDQAPQRTEARSQLDYIEAEILTARCVAYPVISREDIWVGSNYNDRYIIDQCVPTSLYKGVPVVYTLSMKKLPQSDIVYTKTVENLIEDSYVNWETIGK